MKTFFKILLGLIATACAGVAVLALAVQMFVTPDKVKALIESRAPEFLHRRVQLGAIDVGLFSGLEIAEVKISERPDFSQGVFFSAQHVVVHPRILPLFAKKFLINRFDVTKPRIAITRLMDGKTFNFSDLTGSPVESSSATAPAPTPAANPMTFLVSRARITDGQLLLLDQSKMGFGPMGFGLSAKPDAIDLKNVNLQNIMLAGPIQIEARVGFPWNGTTTDLDFGGVASPLTSSIKIKRCILTSGASKVSAEGDVNDFSSEAPKLNLNLAFENIDKTFLAKISTAAVPLAGPLAGNASVNGVLTDMNVSAKLSMASLTLNASGTIKGDTERIFKMKGNTNAFAVKDLLVMAGPGALPKELKLSGNIELGFDYTGTANSGTLAILVGGTALDLAYGDSFKKAPGQAFGWESNGRYSTPTRLDFQQAKLTLGQMELKGPGSFKSEAKGSSYLFQFISNTFPLEDLAKSVTALQEYGPSGNANLTMKLNSAADGAAVKGKLDLKNGGMGYQGGRLENVISDVDYVITAGGDKIDCAGSLKAAQITHEYLKGENLNLTWALTNITPDLSKLNGKASLKQGKGEVQNIQKLTDGSKGAKIFLYPLTLIQKLDKATKGALKLPPLDRITFKDINGDYVFRSGTMDITKFIVDGDQLDTDMKGTIGLAGAQSLNLKANLKLAAGLVGGTVADLLADSDGRTSLSMTIKGTMAEPETSIEMKEIKKKAVEEIKQKVVTEENIQKAKDFFKGILGK